MEKKRLPKQPQECSSPKELEVTNTNQFNVLADLEEHVELEGTAKKIDNTVREAHVENDAGYTQEEDQ